MKKVTISIPSRGRPAWLKQCLESISQSTYRNIEIVVMATSFDDLPGEIRKKGVFHSEYKSMMWFHLNIETMVHVYFFPSLPVIDCQNFVASVHRTPDSYFLPMSDDMSFDQLCIANAVTSMEFDGDFIVGLNTVNMKAKDTSVMLVGDKYLQRFPASKPFYPGYRHFAADTELGETAKYFGRFKLCEDAHIEHYHPNSGREIDQTHVFARRYLKEDLELESNRVPMKRVWGNFEDLVNQKREESLCRKSRQSFNQTI